MGKNHNQPKVSKAQSEPDKAFDALGRGESYKTRQQGPPLGSGELVIAQAIALVDAGHVAGSGLYEAVKAYQKQQGTRPK